LLWALLKGDREEAIGAAERATRIDPNHAGAWYVRGEIERTGGDAEAALRFLDEAIKRVAGHIPARNARTALLIDAGDFNAARTDVEFVRVRMPSDPQSAYLHARILFRDGHRAAAREALSAAASSLGSMDPDQLRDHAPSALLAGVVAQAQERHEDAYQYFNSYVARFGFNVVANSRLASLALKRGEHKRARVLIEPVLKAEPDNGRARVVMGDALLRAGKADEARVHLREAVRSFPSNPVVAMQLARAQIGAGDVGAGQLTLEKVHAAYPRNTIAAMSLGMLYLRRAESEKARDLARSVLEADPESAQAFNLLGAAHTALGELEQADRSFERGLALDPGSVSLRVNRAKLAIRDGRFQVAREQYLAILERDKTSVTAMLGLANLARAEFNEDDTVRWLEQASNSGSSASVTAAVNLVDHYLATKDLNAAKRKLDELEGRHWGDLRVLAAKGRYELTAGNRQQAVDIFDRLARASGDNVRALVAAASLQRGARDLKGARWSLSRAVELSPRDGNVLSALARLDIIAGAQKHAWQRIAQLRKLGGNRVLSLAARVEGDLHMANNNFAKALAAYVLSGELGGESSELTLLKYRARRLGGDPVGAIGVLSTWLKEQPDDLLVRRQRGTALMAAGDDAQAAKDFEMVLLRTPRDVLVLNNLANVLLTANADRALLMARRARDLLPEDGAVADTLGWLLVKAGEHERALELLREARQRAGNVPDVRYHLAVVLHELGRFGEARRELDELLGSGVKFADREEAVELLELIPK
jgi:putative PEP-CTERM system TPR-repeat lipoprotein